MRSRFALTVLALVVALGSALESVVAAQGARNLKLPPITYLCPMNGAPMAGGTIHSDVYEDKPGSCPICKMALVATRLEASWTCPVHSVIHERQAGLCPIDKRELVPVTVALSWTCKANPEIDQITPAKCPDGSAMIAKYTPRPHGNHNPQHGGQFFMAPDNWTHLEGTLPQDRVVRIYLYDDYTKPLPREKFAPVRGRIITKVTTGGTTKEASFPLMPAHGGQYLEARVDTARPGAVVAKITLKTGGPEHHFDFTFNELTKGPAPAASTSTAAKPAATRIAPARTAQPATQRGSVGSAAGARTPAEVATPRASASPASSRAAVAPASEAAAKAAATPAPALQATAPAAPTTTQAASPDPPVMVNAALINVPIPGSLDEIVAEIGVRDRRIRELVEAGRFVDIWLPAFEAKDLALALNSYGPGMPTYKRRNLDPAIKQLLHAAWMLDSFGDLGNREQVDAAYARFSSSVTSLNALLHAGQP
jgi:hypothetical protein